MADPSIIGIKPTIHWTVLLGAIGIVISLWKIHDTIYESDLNKIDNHFNRIDDNLMQFIKDDRSELILQEIRDNKHAIEKISNLIEKYRGTREWAPIIRK